MNDNILGSLLLALPELMERLGDGDHARSGALCPFCKDPSQSFFITKKRGATHRWQCKKCSKEGGCLEYLMFRNRLTEQDASVVYKEISGTFGGLWVAKEHREGYRAGDPSSQADES
jgi:ribosomal protein L37AE/L43A